jgi:hypothetical protein
MRKLTYVLAILAAASTAAFANDLKQDNKASSSAPTISATQMNDAEMDKVTAGQGTGIGTADEHGRGRHIDRPDFFAGAPGSGRCIHHPACL